MISDTLRAFISFLLPPPIWLLEPFLSSIPPPLPLTDGLDPLDDPINRRLSLNIISDPKNNKSDACTSLHLRLGPSLPPSSATPETMILCSRRLCSALVVLLVLSASKSPSFLGRSKHPTATISLFLFFLEFQLSSDLLGTKDEDVVVVVESGLPLSAITSSELPAKECRPDTLAAATLPNSLGDCCIDGGTLETSFWYIILLSSTSKISSGSTRYLQSGQVE